MDSCNAIKAWKKKKSVENRKEIWKCYEDDSAETLTCLPHILIQRG